MIVYTSTLAYQGDDRLDVSRKGNHRLGVHFAPSLQLLNTALRARERGRMMQWWLSYRQRYIDEMLASQREHPEAWEEMTSKEEVTLCCYCPVATHCHRVVLADILRWGFGAVYEGER